MQLIGKSHTELVHLSVTFIKTSGRKSALKWYLVKEPCTASSQTLKQAFGIPRLCTYYDNKEFSSGKETHNQRPTSL